MIIERVWRTIGESAIAMLLIANITEVYWEDARIDSYTIEDLLQSGCSIDSPKRQKFLEVTLNGFGVKKDGDEIFVKTNAQNFLVIAREPAGFSDPETFRHLRFQTFKIMFHFD